MNDALAPFDFQPRTRIVFAPGALGRLGEIARGLGFRRALVVSDAGLAAAGHPERAARLLAAAGVEAVPFHDFDGEPDGSVVVRGAEAARLAGADALVAVGGGSAMDCAKGLNFVHTNGGTIADYRGYGRATRPLLPMIAVPTTAGTGSDAQSYALISDPVTHEKMACGDPGAAFRAAILDPELTVSQPRPTTAAAGYDALSHAVEAFVTRKRNALSEAFAREAFRLLEGHFERVLDTPDDVEARGAMLLGAHLAGMAIEASMLGATHACANPLSARYGTAHGVAIALMLPHVVRWNAPVAGPAYASLLATALRPAGADPAATLAERLDALARHAGLPRALREAGVERDHLPALAEDAGRQWTGGFNPRPFTAADALDLYRTAF